MCELSTVEIVQSDSESMSIINCNDEALSYMWWHPWVNTYGYYPLTANWNDQSGNNRNLTVWSGITFSETNGAYLPNTSHTWMLEPFQITSSWNWTIARWQKVSADKSNDQRWIDIYWNSSNRICTLWDWNKQWLYVGWDTRQQRTETANIWYHHVVTIQNWSVKFYIDNQLKYTWSITKNLTSSYFRWWQEYNNAYPRQLYWYFKDIIVENAVWSASDIDDYRNDKKSEFNK